MSVWMHRLYRHLIRLTSLVIPFLGFVWLTERIVVTVLLMQPESAARIHLCLSIINNSFANNRAHRWGSNLQPF